MKSVAVLAAVLLISPLALEAQNPPTAAPAPKKPAATVHHQPNFNSERVRADALYTAGKFVEALPLYEDLCRQDPANALFAERHGAGIIAKAGSVDDPKQKQAIIAEGIKELERAESLGDTSLRVQDVLGTYAMVPTSLVAAEPAGGFPLTVGYTYEGSPQAQPLVKRGEFAFAQNDLPTALENSIAAAVADPTWYSAALLAGATSYRMGDIKDACTWFARAVAIDPDFHAAYRTWGNALMTAGDTEGARVKYEQAVAAEPYSKSAFVGLQQWATLTHNSLVHPQVVRPDFTAPDGKLAIDPPLTTETGDGHSSWLIYQQRRVAYGARSASQATMEGSTSDTGGLQVHPHRLRSHTRRGGRRAHRDPHRREAEASLRRCHPGEARARPQEPARASEGQHA